MKQLTIYIKDENPIRLSCPDDIILDINHKQTEEVSTWIVTQREPPTEIAIINGDYFKGIVFATKGIIEEK